MRQVATSRWGALLDDTRTLRPAADGWELADRKDPIHSGFAPVRADAPVVISSDSKPPSAAAGGSAEPVHHGRIEIHPRDRGAVEGVVAGNALVYPEVAESADLVVTLRRNGVEELLVLRDDSAAHTLRYRLVLEPGMTVADASGGLTIFDALGRHFLRMTPLAAADATGAQVPVTMEWHQDGDAVDLSLTVASGDTYPVVVDPAWLYGVGFPEATIVAYSDFECRNCEVFGDVSVVNGPAAIYKQGGQGTPSSKPYDGWIHGDVEADDVHLQGQSGQGQATVTGDVTYNDFTSGGPWNIFGSQITPLAVPLQVSVPVVPPVVAGTVNVTSGTNLGPGAYGSLTVTAGMLHLTGGVYSFTDITLSSPGKLQCDGLCEIRVAGDITMSQSELIGSLDPADVTVFCLGDFVASRSYVSARVVVLNGLFSAEGQGNYEGRFIADDVVTSRLSGWAPKFQADSGALESDCQAYCQDAVGSNCSQSPPSESQCIEDCEAWMLDPFCSTQARWFVDCFTESAGSDYCDAEEIPMREYCENEWAALAECQVVCADIANDLDDCTDDVCDCMPGACNGAAYPPSAQGTSCSDGNPCTVPATGSCDGAGTCLAATPAPPGTPCPDANICDGTEVCDGSGACPAFSGFPPDFDDGDPCTIDDCDELLGETHVPLAGDGSDPCEIKTCHAVGEVAEIQESTCADIDPTVPTQIGTSTSFLYTDSDPNDGIDPVQVADVGEPALHTVIDPARVAVLRGRVLDDLGYPLAGVEVRVLELNPNEPSYGHTFTQTNGNFDMAVNGGGQQTLVFRRAGLISIQRTVQVPWLDFVNIGDVVMVAYDTTFTNVNLSAVTPATEIQVHREFGVHNDDGTRQATLLFKPGTTAAIVTETATNPVLESLDIRATEFTVGPNGPQKMPGTLPPESAYTYAVELSADGVGDGDRVEFSEPVIFYLENFLDLDDVGGPVPVGYYDRTEGRWIGAPNGRIIEIVAISGNPAEVELDIDGSGTANTSQELEQQLGIDQAERQKLATLYPAGQSLWRVPIPHFTPWDCNWPFSFPDDGPPPNPPDPNDDDPPDDPCDDPNASSVECQGQVLHEQIELVGTPFNLHHASDRVPGRKAAFELEIPLIGTLLPEPLKGIELEVSIAGERHVWSFDCAPESGPPDPKCATGSSFVFEWDGLDAYGRRMQAEQSVQVRLGWTYQAVYSRGRSDFEVSFARFGDAPMSANPARQRVTVWREWQGALGILDAAAMGLAGWSVSQHHVYSPASGTVFFGDGRRKTRAALEPIVTSVGGGGFACAYWADEPASEAAMDDIRGVAVALDGTIYYAQVGDCGSVVRKLTTGGMVVHVAGTGSAGYNGDGIPATTAKLAYPSDVAFGVDGTLYIADSGNFRVRHVDPTGIITTVAGSGGTGTFSGDGGLAVDATLGQIPAIAIGRDGSLYIADSNNNRVRRVAPDGVIDTVVGGGATNSLSAL